MAAFMAGFQAAASRIVGKHRAWHALARLRRGTGDKLFTRTRHGMQPTPHALAMAQTLARPARH